MNFDKIYLAARTLYDAEGFTTGFEVMGAFTRPGYAEACCTKAGDWVGPIVLDVPLPEHVYEWPGLYYFDPINGRREAIDLRSMDAPMPAPSKHPLLSASMLGEFQATKPDHGTFTLNGAKHQLKVKTAVFSFNQLVALSRLDLESDTEISWLVGDKWSKTEDQDLNLLVSAGMIIKVTNRN